MGRKASNLQFIKLQLNLLSTDYQILSILAGPHTPVTSYISDLIQKQLTVARGTVNEALTKLSAELRGEPITPNLPFEKPAEPPLTNTANEPKLTPPSTTPATTPIDNRKKFQAGK